MTVISKRTHPHGCPVSATLSVIGGKWKAIIIFILIKNGTLRYGELKRRIPSVTQRMLTSQLRELEQDGIIIRTVYEEKPAKVEYAISEYGYSLHEILKAMHVWGETHQSTLLLK